ncbi:MAG: hypothetical protein ABI480_05425 [Chitinophagaceae bacterium]
MWSEELDNNLRNAADKDIPPYDEKTWDGMHQLLEKHLPQKKNRRGVIFFLFLGLMVLVPGIYMVTKLSSHTDSVAQQQPSDNTNSTITTTGKQVNNIPVTSNDNEGTDNTISDKKSIPNSSNTTTTEKSANTNVQTTSISTPTNNNTTTPIIQQSTNNNITTPSIVGSNKNTNSKKAGAQKNTATGTNRNINRSLVTIPAIAITNPSASTDNDDAGNKSTPATTSVVTSPDKKQTTTTSQPVSAPANTVGSAIVSNAAATTTAAVEKSVVKPIIDSAITTTTNPVATNKKQVPAKKGNKLTFMLSFGPDVTSVGVDRLGKVKSEVGISVGYPITNKLGIRAGFFAGRKIYSADSTNYHTPWTSSPYRLYNIDANCYVYEIPVSFTYSLGVTEKHNWFVSGGLSSYIMKEEKYLYTYKSSPSSLSPYYYEHDLKNENKHFFSVLNLSGGYQYNVSKRLSLMAEPYLKLPLSGIGAGKVKLNSTGILFTVAVRPFAH